MYILIVATVNAQVYIINSIEKVRVRKNQRDMRHYYILRVSPTTITIKQQKWPVQSAGGYRNNDPFGLVLFLNLFDSTVHNFSESKAINKKKKKT